jgi:uncharacterized protein YpmB
MSIPKILLHLRVIVIIDVIFTFLVVLSVFFYFWMILCNPYLLSGNDNDSRMCVGYGTRS